MSRLRSNHIARASLGAVFAASLAATAPAPAAAQTIIDGGGATLPALLLRELFDCFAVPPGGTIGSPLPARCTSRVTGAFSFRYDSVGSGAGLRGWVSQDPLRFSATSTLTDVNFGVSEAALTAAQLGAYNNGGRFSSTGPTDIADVNDACLPPATGNGQDVAPPGGCYDNPRVENGPAIQIPFAAAGVTIAFDPAYKGVRLADGSRVFYMLNNTTPRADGSGGLRLSRAAFCGIFSGQITTWDHPVLTAANGGVPMWPSPADPDAGTPGYSDGRAIVVVHRDDDSGTTALFTRALRAQCGNPGQFDATALPAGFSVRFPGSPAASLPSGSTACLNVTNSLFDNPNGPAQFVAARGNEGVATCVNTPEPARRGDVTIGGRIGYLSPSFVLPTVTVQPFRGFALATFDVENRRGRFIAPTPGAVTAGLGVQTVPVGADRANPLNWVADPSGANPANVVADPDRNSAYPIVGTANLLLYTCYATQAKVDAFARLGGPGVPPGFLNWVMANGRSVNSIVRRNGFAPLPSDLRSAIAESFANPSDPAGLNLFIRATPSGLCTTGS